MLARAPDFVRSPRQTGCCCVCDHHEQLLQPNHPLLRSSSSIYLEPRWAHKLASCGGRTNPLWAVPTSVGADSWWYDIHCWSCQYKEHTITTWKDFWKSKSYRSSQSLVNGDRNGLWFTISSKLPEGPMTPTRCTSVKKPQQVYDSYIFLVSYFVLLTYLNWQQGGCEFMI